MKNLIKFRIWDKEYKDWIAPNRGGITCEGEILCYRQGGFCPGWLEENNKDNFIVQYFTGYFDENNKEIYDGDIIHQSQRQFECLVFWDNGWKTKDLCGGFIECLGMHDPNRIIGNVCQNSNLLKELLC